MLKITKILLLTVLSMASVSVSADGLAQLKNFMDEMKSFSGDFIQTVYDANSEPVQESTGVMTLKRPGLFYWKYLEPSPQLIVSNGEKIWVYDEDLAQVTIRQIDENLGTTPIMLLGGSAPLRDAFELKDLGTAEGVDWVELKPKKTESDFEAVYVGFTLNHLVAMELRDKFGQATQIKLSKTKFNQAIDESLFQFVAPEGVDVLGE